MRAGSFSSLSKILSSVAKILCTIALAGSVALLFISCSSRTTGGKLNVTTHQHASTEESKALLNAPGASDAEPIKTRLTELFDLCKNNETEKAASYFVYRGADKNREWKDTLRANDPTEKASVEELCRRINGYTDNNRGYSFGELKVESESEGEWHALEVLFRQGAENKKVTFAFLLIQGRFAIGDIDN